MSETYGVGYVKGKVGVGISTYNRKPVLEECLSGVLANTDLNITYVMVSDDGSSDGSAEMAKSLGFPTLKNKNKGVARNKNRILYHMFVEKGFRTVILLEDDVKPIKKGWEGIWHNGATIYGSVFYLSHGEGYGDGSICYPFRVKKTTAQIVALSESAFLKVGYFDSRFKGFGYEHCEWQNRMLRNGDGGYISGKDYIFTALNSDSVEVLDTVSTGNTKLMEANSKIYVDTFNDKGFKLPYSSEHTRKKFIDECRNFL